jgi:hypothetical protein
MAHSGVDTHQRRGCRAKGVPRHVPPRRRPADSARRSRAGRETRRQPAMVSAPVTARKARLSIGDPPGGPTIWEFTLLPPR